jgi:hypothetical protein
MIFRQFDIIIDPATNVFRHFKPYPNASIGKSPFLSALGPAFWWILKLFIEPNIAKK